MRGRPTRISLRSIRATNARNFKSECVARIEPTGRRKAPPDDKLSEMRGGVPGFRLRSTWATRAEPANRAPFLTSMSDFRPRPSDWRSDDYVHALAHRIGDARTWRQADAAFWSSRTIWKPASSSWI